MKRLKSTLLTGLTAFTLACGPAAQPADVGTAMPDYAAASPNGDSLRLASLKGSVVLLNVWATWCIPCRKELPELQALHQEYESQGLRIVGVSVDEPGTDADVVDFAKSFGLTYTILHDPEQRISDVFRIPGVPASFVIDRAGIIRWRHLGPFKATDTTFTAVLQKALASVAAPTGRNLSPAQKTTRRAF